MYSAIPSVPRGSKIYPITDAKQNAYPFTVYIAYIPEDGTPYHMCSGSLIHRLWVLTAAHCLYSGANHVVLGTYDRTETENTTQTIKIAEEIIYPGFNIRNISFDVGLIRLAKRANIRSEAVGLVSLLSSESRKAKFLANTKPCKVLGWGNVKFEDGWRVAEKQQELDIRWVTDEEAENRGYYLGSGTLASEAIYKDECNDGSICFGDSGGPLVCKQGGTWVQVALTSYLSRNDGCITGIKINADVVEHLDWITAVVGLKFP